VKHNNAGNATLVANDAERIPQPQENARIGANESLAGLASISLLIAIIAFFLRAFRLDQAIDLHIDEIYYIGISHSLEKSIHPTFNGLPFYIHPPALFVIESLYFKVMHLKGNEVHDVFAARYINIMLSSLCAAAFFVMGYSIARWRAGLLAASLLAFDPFVVRINGWNILETPAIFWVVLGYALIFPAMSDERSHLPVWRAIIAGCAFGMGMLTKETTAFLTVFPLTICFILHWSLTRRTLVVINMVAVSCYGIYVAIVIAIGDWRYLQNQKLSGLSRFIGVTKPTGFVPGFARKPTAPSVSDRPSLLDAIISNLERLGTTYVLLGTGLIAICILLQIGGARKHLLATWAACAYALIVYSVLFGTLEEQFFYFVIPSSILATVVAGTLLFHADAWPSLFTWPTILGWTRRRPNLDDIRANVAYLWVVKAARVMFAGVIALIIIWSISAWISIHTATDNGYDRLIGYLEHNVPLGSRVAVGDELQDLLLDNRYTTGKWVTPESIRINHAQYAVISAKNVEKGYGYARLPFYRWLMSNATLVFSFNGKRYGVLSVYAIPDDSPPAVTDYPREATPDVRLCPESSVNRSPL
jgi:hypothetical protein